MSAKYVIVPPSVYFLSFSLFVLLSRRPIVLGLRDSNYLRGGGVDIGGRLKILFNQLPFAQNGQDETTYMPLKHRENGATPEQR